MKVLERHENNFEEYAIHTCKLCGSKLDILEEDCKIQPFTHLESNGYSLKQIGPDYKSMYVCDCPVCGTEIHIDRWINWSKRPKVYKR